MVAKAVASILVGLGVASLCVVPYLVFQYRRYGRFSASRLIWTLGLLVYGTALVSYTLFPLPSAAYCATPHDLLELDPTVYFRDAWAAHANGASWTSVLTSWTVLQMALNVLLFLPLGIFVRHLWRWGLGRATLLGFGLSLLIELTQYTGNWFTAPCPYRVADVNDLMTNTLGAFLGGLLAMLLPRLVADAATMTASRQFARPITRGRRLTGMLFDLVGAALVLVAVKVTLAVAYVAIAGVPTGDRTTAATFGSASTLVAELAVVAFILVFAATGSGASLGQRLVYLKPVPTVTPARPWLLLRAFAVQGLAAALAFWVSAPAAAAWLAVSVVWVFFRPRGLSLTLARCDLADTRPSPAED